jgi:hypothetical protein
MKELKGGTLMHFLHEVASVLWKGQSTVKNRAPTQVRTHTIFGSGILLCEPIVGIHLHEYASIWIHRLPSNLW